jgi:5-oxoprolinase (ATP-hydrolysing) subunit C
MSQSEPIFQIIDPGWSASLQDQGRHGWRRFGVPSSGALDDHAAAVANRLLHNPPWAPVLELLWHGAQLEALSEAWIALTGADTLANIPRWRLHRVKKGERIRLPHRQSGVWSYLAVEGGWRVPLCFESASTLLSAGLGQPLTRGTRLYRDEREPRLQLPSGIGGRLAPPADQRDYHAPPALRVWPAPQSDQWTTAGRDTFFSTAWRIAPQSNRLGYRLDGPPLTVPTGEMISEPVLPGSIQITPSGAPIVILADGPTIGGYPKIGLIHRDDISWLAQCAPGQDIRFTPAE